MCRMYFHAVDETFGDGLHVCDISRLNLSHTLVECVGAGDTGEESLHTGGHHFNEQNTADGYGRRSHVAASASGGSVVYGHAVRLHTFGSALRAVAKVHAFHFH